MNERPLSGALAQLSVPDLLQTAETSRRSGTIELESRGRTARLWLRDGRVIDAEVDGGPRGQEAVFAVATWGDGSFEADFRPVSVPERIFESTSFLLLEAMRRHDEARRDEPPPYAAIPDPPPPPPRAVLAVHRALTLLAVTASYAAEHLAAELTAKRLESHRRALLDDHSLLRSFAVDAEGRPSLATPLAENGDFDVDALVAAVSAWLRRVFTELENALPGRFSLRKLRTLTEAVGDDLRSLGYYQALGLTGTGEEKS